MYVTLFLRSPCCTNVAVVCYRNYCNAVFLSFLHLQVWPKHVSTCAPFLAHISMREIYYPPSPPSAFPLCVWGDWKGYAHQPPPIHGISVTAQSLQWPSLLLNVVESSMVSCWKSHDFGWTLQAAQLKLKHFLLMHALWGTKTISYHMGIFSSFVWISGYICLCIVLL